MKQGKVDIADINVKIGIVYGLFLIIALLIYIAFWK